MTVSKTPGRGPTLRLICVNDVYSLDHLPRLCNLVRHYAKSEPADLMLTTLAGDFVGPSMLSSLDKGRGMIDALNTIGVTHVIFGNHEDDIDIGELRDRIAEFRGCWLNTNMPTFVPELPTHQILEVTAPGGRTVRVGLLGVVMEDATVYRRKPFGGAQILPANATALGMARLLHEQGCTCVIPLTHQEMADDRRLAVSQISPPFPVILGGHEHKVFLEEIEKTWIIKAGTDAQFAAVVDLEWPADAPASGPDAPTVNVRLENVANYPEDAALRARVNARMAAVHELEAATLMPLPDGVTLSSVGTRSRQTTVGRLLASRIRDVECAEGCLLNGGGIRASREYKGHFTYGDLKAELPFDNEIAVVALPGRVVRDAVRASRAQAPQESGGFLQVDDRMRVEQPGDALVEIAGEPISDERIYRIAIMRNLMTGMDHIEPLVQYAKAVPACLPAEGSGREIKVVLVDAFSRELWRQLGSFESLDTDQDGSISGSEIAAAVSRVTAAPASKITVEILMRTLDADHDQMISREEAQAVRRKLGE